MKNKTDAMQKEHEAAAALLGQQNQAIQKKCEIQIKEMVCSTFLRQFVAQLILPHILETLVCTPKNPETYQNGMHTLLTVDIHVLN